MLKRKFEETEGISQNGEEGGNPESDDSNCSAGSTDALAPDAVDQPPAKRPKKRVNFKGVTVYYFPRRQGFTCVPSEGGSTLGMSERHTFHRDFSLSDYTKEQKRIHRVILAEQRRQGKLFPSPLLGNASTAIGESTDDISSGSESDSEYDDYYFLQPLPIRQRRVLLRTSGVKKIDNEEKDVCRDIRVSRNVCGCDCKIFCDPETCACSMAGIQCQVDRLSFPCGCTKDGCANPSGRIEFNPIRVKTHFIHTLMRLELERKDREIQDGTNSTGACVLGNICSLSPSASMLSSQALASSEDSIKIVDVVGEDGEIGMEESEDDTKVVNGSCDKVHLEEVDDKKEGSCSIGSDASSNGNSISNDDDASAAKTLKSNLKSKKEEAIDLNLFNSNERGSCRDCQNTDMCNVMMHDVKFSMVSQQQRQQHHHQQQQQQRAMAQSLFNGQQILHSHALSPPSPGLSLFQPLPQQTASTHHHMMMFNDTEEEGSYHADTSGPLYFDHDENSYSEISEPSTDSSFPVITRTSTANFRPGSSVMFTTTMNTQSPGSGPISSPVRIMRPQVSLLNRSTLNQFGIRPVEMSMPTEFVAGGSSDLGIAPPICNGVTSSLSPPSQQQQPPLQHQHAHPDQPMLPGSKVLSSISQSATDHCDSEHLVSSLESTAEGMSSICHALNQAPSLNQQRNLNDSTPQNGPLTIPTPESIPVLSMGFADSSSSNHCGTLHTSLVSSHGKSTNERSKQDAHLMPEHNYGSVLAVPIYHASPNHSEGEFEPNRISSANTATTSAGISINSISSTADSDSGLQHQQPLLSCWSASLTSPTIPECFTGMGSNSIVPPSLMSQPASEPTKTDSRRPVQSHKTASPSQAMPSPSSTTYATMTTTTRDQLATYCPGISSHMDNRIETNEAQCPAAKETESTFPDFPMDSQDSKPTSSLLADSQNILFCPSFSQPVEPDSSTLSPASSASAPTYSPFIMSLTSGGKGLDDPTSVTSSLNCQSLPVHNGLHLETAKDEQSNNGISTTSQFSNRLTFDMVKPDQEGNLSQSDCNESNKAEPQSTSHVTPTSESLHKSRSLTDRDSESCHAESSFGLGSSNDENVIKANASLANGETSLNVSAASSQSSSSSLATSAALSLSSLPSSTLPSSSSSSSSSSASSISSSDDEQKGMGQEFNDIVKKPMAEMVSA